MKIKICVILVLIIFLTIPLGVYAAQEDGEKEAETSKQFKIFKWTVTIGEDGNEPKEESVEDKVNKMIKSSDNEVIVKEREKVTRKKELIERKLKKKIDRIKKSEQIEIDKAKDRAESRVKNANSEAKRELKKLDGQLRAVALEIIEKEQPIVKESEQ